MFSQFSQEIVKSGSRNQETMHKSERESLTLRQCDAFTGDVPPSGLFIEQLEVYLVTTSDFGISIIFYTLGRNSSIFTLYFPA